MYNILVLTSAVTGAQSVSDALVEAAVAELRLLHPDAQVVRRDLSRDPVPHLTAANLAGVRGEPSTPEEIAARRLSDTLVAELKAADFVVIGSPMYNFSIPSTLRSWFDFVLRAGVTFTYADGAPRGLVGRKPVLVLESRGGVYSEGPGAAADFQEPYLRHLLGFLGLDDVRVVRAEGVALGPDSREQAVRAAIGALGAAVAPEAMAA